AAVDAAIVTTKTPGTAWAAGIAAKILAHGGVGVTIQNGLGNYETLVEHLGAERAAVGVIYVGAELVKGELRATGPGKVELGRPAAADRRDLRCCRPRGRAARRLRSSQSGDDAARRLARARLGRDGGLHLRVPIGLIAFTEEPPRAHRAFSFDVNRPSRLAHEV